MIRVISKSVHSGEDDRIEFEIAKVLEEYKVSEKQIISMQMFPDTRLIIFYKEKEDDCICRCRE